MSTKINVQVLDVGQGSGNLIEIYGATLTHLVLVDLGSELERSTAGVAAARYVVNKLMGLTPHTLDALILSHSDSDHINLLDVLLINFDPPNTPPPSKPILTINKIYYGGDRTKYKKRKINYLKKAEAYLKPSPANTPKPTATSFNPDISGWDATAAAWKPFHISDDVAFFMVIGNTIADAVDLVVTSTKKRRKLQPSYNINTKSFVVGVRSPGAVDWVLTGDATGLTLAKCNEVFTSAGSLTNCFMVTMPHHSSETTTFDLGGIATTTLDPFALAEQNLSDFVNHVKAQTISASAEQDAGFRHPSQRVISYFWPRLAAHIWFTEHELGTNNHFYNAYVLNKAYKLQKPDLSQEDWPKRGGWYTIQTAANVFTTLYYVANQQKGILLPPSPATEVKELVVAQNKKAPAIGVQWAFTVDAGAKSITNLPNRDVLAAAAALGLPPLIWPTRESLSLKDRSFVDTIPTATEPDGFHVPVAQRVAPAKAPRNAASPLRRLHAIY
jgi:hypothetical protein